MVKKKKPADKDIKQEEQIKMEQDFPLGNRAHSAGKEEAITDPEGASGETVAGEVTQLKQEMASLHDSYLRLYSEFDNYRKRTQRERADLLKTAASGLITQLLPVLDDFDRAARSFDSVTDIVAMREGVALIHGKLRKILEQKGLEEIRSVGEPFDTDLHEAITNLPAESDEMRGKVVDEIEKGYMLNGTVIRYAKVAVAN